MLRRDIGSIVALIGGCAVFPALLLWLLGTVMVMPPPWVHFYGVGMTALAATAAAVALTTAGARAADVRTVVVGGGFAVMAALLAVHGIVTPGVVVGSNGVVALTGGATLPVGAAVLAISGMPSLATAKAIPRILALEALCAVAIVVVSVVGILVPSLVPSVPEPKSPAALTLFAVGLLLFGALAKRAAKTYLLTRRAADLAVVFGLVLLASSLYGALILSFMDLGWWLGHIFEVVGIALVGASAAYDLRRGRRSRPLAGDLRAREIVASEEAFLGARIRALMVRLAAKDASTEEHTRRVAALAVEVGEQLGLPAGRLRSLAIGGLLHDMGKLSVPDAILQKPGPLDEDEFAQIRQHPVRGRELLDQLGGFDELVERLVGDHHERLDGQGYPNGLRGDAINLETRILTVCDVYDALVSPRVYRPAWTTEKALEILRSEAGTAFDPVCVDALVQILGGNVAALPATAVQARLAPTG
jgi:HD-GYP domain-containing protein (c-di-GMP phosphodiesterase class II)